jgi:hypothetical protein
MKRALLAPLHPVLAVYIGLWAAPATWWYEPRALIVAQEAPAMEPQVALERAIHHTFNGSYTVDVRDAASGALVCGRGGSHRYRGGLTGTFNTGLAEFAGNDLRCAALPTGVYYAEACWTVETPLWGALPPKTVCEVSNPFRVTARSVQPRSGPRNGDKP